MNFNELYNEARQNEIVLESTCNIIDNNGGFQKFLKDLNMENCSKEEIFNFFNSLDDCEIENCVDCGIFKIVETDISLCEKCMQNYDMNEFWNLHDEELDEWFEPYDFNENEEIRNRFKMVKN